MGSEYEQLERQVRESRQKCPFCLHYERKTHEVEHGDNDYWTVVCLNCGAEGPLSATEKGAEQRWVERSKPRHIHNEELDGNCICGRI